MAVLDDDTLTWVTIALVAYIVFLATSFIRSDTSKSSARPPGPPGRPFVGNIFDIGTNPLHNLQQLKSRYGPVLWLRLGTVNTVFVQSPEAAAELFKKHDLAFCDRTVPDSVRACGYHKGSLVHGSYGQYWRIMRRLCVTEFTTPKRIDDSASLRKRCIDSMIRWIEEDAVGSGEIQLPKYLYLMSFNLVSGFMLSREEMEKRTENGNNFFEAMEKFVEWSGKPNIVDVYGFLRWIDPQGIRRNTGRYLGQLLDLVSGFVEERIRRERTETSDFLDALLEYRGPDGSQFSKKIISIIILEMFFGGTETTSTTIEWAMAELLHNPDTMRKLKVELDHVVGGQMVQEDDINRLPYLQAVVKETMRLHPSLPLLLPRKARHDTEYKGYMIPKNTTIVLNTYAIHRDGDAWTDPLCFKPERFLNSSIDSKGQHYELIPFGSGRRSCIGMLLGNKIVSLTLARLVQWFDWELPAGVDSKTLDMRESLGITLRKLVPLTAIPKQSKA